MELPNTVEGLVRAQALAENALTLIEGVALRLKLPFVYRVHEAPDPERIEKLKQTLTAAGVDFHFAGDTPTTLCLLYTSRCV